MSTFKCIEYFLMLTFKAMHGVLKKAKGNLKNVVGSHKGAQ